MQPDPGPRKAGAWIAIGIAIAVAILAGSHRKFATSAEGPSAAASHVAPRITLTLPLN